MPGAPETLREALCAYFFRDVFPPEYNAARDYTAHLETLRRDMPLRGSVPADHAYAFGLLEQRERRLMDEGAKSGSGVDTELRDVYSKIEGFGPFAERSKLLKVVQRINKLDRVVDGKIKKHRTNGCLRKMSKEGPKRDGQRVVEVVSEGEKPPRYRGVTVCGDAWVCPVCATKATEVRRKELRAGALAWRENGGQLILVTGTFPHKRADELGLQWKKLSAARQDFARSAEFKKFREDVGHAGRVASREVTYGCNGWHPHWHELVFVAAAITEETVDHWASRLAKAWQTACVMNDLDAPSLEHGFKMSLTEVDEYIAKWGIDAELTKWHIKRARPGDGPSEQRLNGYTPFDLLRIHAGELEAAPQLKISTDRAAALFAEYAHAVAGTAQLHWSRGLKKRLEDVGADFDDDERAPGDDDDEVLHGVLSAADWFTICTDDHQVEFLGLVHCKGWDFAMLMLDEWRGDQELYRRRRVKAAVRNAGLAYLWRGGP